MFVKILPWEANLLSNQSLQSDLLLLAAKRRVHFAKINQNVRNALFGLNQNTVK